MEKLNGLIKKESSTMGRSLSTAGGLVITGTPEGKLLAFDDTTGEVLYSFNVGSRNCWLSNYLGTRW